jgi:hypothetical protein
MAGTAAGWAIPAVLLAVLTLAGCTNIAASSLEVHGSSTTTKPFVASSASPTARPSSTAPSTDLATLSPSVRSCRQLYETWKHGAVAGPFQADFDYITSKQGADDVPRLTSVLEKAGSAVPGVPLPPDCADPAGYYSQVLAAIKTVSQNARAASGLGQLLMAEAPLKTLAKIKADLRACPETDPVADDQICVRADGV